MVVTDEKFNVIESKGGQSENIRFNFRESNKTIGPGVFFVFCETSDE